MHRKIIGILVCMLFLISSLPTVISVDVKETQEDNNAIFFEFGIIYGLIEFHGEEFIEDYGMCYNTTAIDVTWHAFVLVILYGFDYQKIKIEDKELYIPKKAFLGRVTNRSVFGFLYASGIIPEPN